MVRAPGVGTLRSSSPGAGRGVCGRQRRGGLEIRGVVIAIGEHDRILARTAAST